MNGLKILLTNQMFGTAQAITDEATRLYGILSGKIDMLITLPAALNVAFSTALVPTISAAMANKDFGTAKRRIGFSIRITLLIALPCAVGLAALAEPILMLLFPKALASEAPMLLRLSSIIIIFTLLNQTLGGALQGLGKVMIPAASLACGAIVKLIINLFLIPQIGINGAPIGSIACVLTATIIELYFLHKNMKLDLNIMQAILKPILVSGIMGIIAIFAYNCFKFLIGNASIATLLAIISAVIVYALSMVIFRILDRDDYHMLPYGDKIYKFLQKLKLIKLTNNNG